ncbi:hypothetical protein GZL_03763 [Streptomyces sp. 769]|nr:hypothetical protein GZL_03763 [Streptomyces sp. 769]
MLLPVDAMWGMRAAGRAGATASAGPARRPAPAAGSCRPDRPWACPGGSWPGPRRLARHFAALPKRPDSSAIRTLRRLAMHRTRRRGLSDPDPPDRPWACPGAGIG